MIEMLAELLVNIRFMVINDDIGTYVKNCILYIFIGILAMTLKGEFVVYYIS